MGNTVIPFRGFSCVEWILLSRYMIQLPYMMVDWLADGLVVFEWDEIGESVCNNE